MIKGSIVALITPMTRDGAIDYVALDNLLDWHLASQTDGLVVAGTTGESATLTPDEHSQLMAHVVKRVSGQLPIIAGTGTNATASTLALTTRAKTAGADACLVVTPYYNKPTQNGLYEHYKYVAQHADFPLIIYNVPGRTGCDILPSTVERLSRVEHIIGIKEATGDLNRAQEIRERCGQQFAIYSGDDPTALKLMLANVADGVISVTANVVPHAMHVLSQAALNGNKILAQAINEKLKPLYKKLFIESNPIPTKWALQSMGKIKEGIRLPLLPLDNQYHEEVKQALREAGVYEDVSRTIS